MAGIIRIVVLAVTLVVAFGLILHSVIPYSPTFPLVVLVNSLACLAVGLTANRVGGAADGAAGQPGDAVGRLAYTAVVGGGLMLLFSGISAIFAAVGGGSGGIVGSHGSALLLNLSWPAAVIALAALATGVRAYRRVGQRPDGRPA
jgi:hypothetical protein